MVNSLLRGLFFCYIISLIWTNSSQASPKVKTKRRTYECHDLDHFSCSVPLISKKLFTVFYDFFHTLHVNNLVNLINCKLFNSCSMTILLSFSFLSLSKKKETENNKKNDLYKRRYFVINP